MSKALKECIKKAKEHYDKEEYKEGEVKLKEALEEDKDAAEGIYMFWILFGACQMKLGKKREAEDSYERAIKLDSSNAQAWLGLRNIYTETEELAKLLPVLRKLMEVGTADHKEQAVATILRMVAKNDLGRLSSTAVLDQATKDVASRTGNITSELLGGPVDKVFENCDATLLAEYDRVYKVHPVDDIIWDAVDTPQEKELQANWAMRRLYNVATRTETVGEAMDCIKRIGSLALRGLDDTTSKSSQWVMKIALSCLDSPSCCPEGLFDTVRRVAFKFEHEDEDEAKERAKSIRKNKTEEEVHYEVMQAISGTMLAQVRVSEIVKGSLESIFDIYGFHAAAEWVHSPDIADLEAALKWIDMGIKETPEVVSSYALKASLLFRLGRYGEAIAAAEQGLGCVAFKEKVHLLHPTDAAMWSTRLTAARLLSLCLTDKLPRAQSLATVALAKLREDDPSAPVVCAEVFVCTGNAPAALEALETKGRRGFLAACGFHTKAKAAMLMKEYDEALKHMNFCITTAKKNPNGHFWSTKAKIIWMKGMGMLDPASKEGDDMLEALKTAVELSPYYSEPYRLLGHYFASMERRVDAADPAKGKYTKKEFMECYGGTAEWRTAVPKEKRIDSSDGEAYTKEEFVQCYKGTAEWDDAVPVKEEMDENLRKACNFYRRAVALDPSDNEAAKTLAAILCSRGEGREVLDMVRVIVAHAEKHGAGAIKHSLWAFRLMGYESLNSANYHDAARCFKHSLRLVDDIQTAVALAQAYEGLGSPDRALAQYQIALDKAHADGDADREVMLAVRHGAASCRLLCGEEAKAVEELESMVAEHPDFVPAWASLAQARWACALAGAKTNSELACDTAATLADCMTAATQVTTLNNSSTAWRMKGDLAVHAASLCTRDAALQYLATAAEAYQQVMSLSEKSKAARAHAQYDLARVHFARHCITGDEADRVQAEEQVRGAITLYGRCSSFLVLLGCTLPPSLPNRRLWCFAKALQMNPDDFTAWCNQGWVLLLYGKPDAAVMSFERAQKIKEGAWQPWLGLGLCMQRKSYGSMSYEAKGMIERAHQEAQLPKTALMSLIAQHFYSPRRYGDLPEAMEGRATAIKGFYDNDANALNTIGLVLEELGEYKVANDVYERALVAVCAEGADHLHVLEWRSGQNGLFPTRGNAAWSTCDPYNKKRMILTSLVRTACKQRDDRRMEYALQRLTAHVSAEDMPYFESSTRAVVCAHLLKKRYSDAEALLKGFLPHIDSITHDSILAGISILRAAAPVHDATHILPELSAEAIEDSDIREVAKLVEVAGDVLRSPGKDLNITTEDAAQKIFLFKTLLCSGEGTPPIRFKDPDDSAPIEIRLTPDGTIRYSVFGEFRAPFKTADLLWEDGGHFLDFPELDSSLNLPDTYTDFYPLLLRMFSIAGVTHNGMAPSPRPVKFPSQSFKAAELLVDLVRNHSHFGAHIDRETIETIVEVQYLFSMLLAAMPQIIPDSVAGLHALIHGSIRVLQDISTVKHGVSERTHFKAQLALATLYYAGSSLVVGPEVSWEDVLPVEETGADEEKAVAKAGATNPIESVDDDSGYYRTPLEGCLQVSKLIADEGYVEAATIYGLALYAAGKYEAAVGVLEKTIEEGKSELDWRRWDAHSCLIRSYLMLQDTNGATRALQSAAGSVPEGEAARLECMVKATELVHAGQLDTALRLVRSEAAGNEEHVELQYFAAALSMREPKADLSEALRPVERAISRSLPDGSFLRRNTLASLKACQAVARMKKSNQTINMTQPPSASSQETLQQALEEWPHSVIAQIISVQHNIMKQDPTACTQCIRNLRRSYANVDRSPLVQYWFSFPAALGRDPSTTLWAAWDTLLLEVGSAYLSEQADVVAGEPSKNDHLCAVLCVLIDFAEAQWKTLCPPYEEPDQSKMTVKEYKDAMRNIQGLRKKREKEVNTIREVVLPALDYLASAKPAEAEKRQKAFEALA